MCIHRLGRCRRSKKINTVMLELRRTNDAELRVRAAKSCKDLEGTIGEVPLSLQRLRALADAGSCRRRSEVPTMSSLASNGFWGIPSTRARL